MSRATIGDFKMLIGFIVEGQKDKLIALVQKKNFSEEVYLSEFSRYESPLNKAIDHGHLDIVRILLCHGLGYRGRYERGPLIEACREGRVEIVKALIEKYGYDKTTCNSNNETALMVAGSWGHWDVCKYLVDIGVDVNHVGLQGTVLHACVRMKNLDMCKFILSSGFNNINASDRYDYSALHSAVFANAGSTVKLLLDNGANVNQLTHRGATPFWIAVEHCSLEILKVLYAAGASVDVPSADQLIHNAITRGTLVAVHFLLVTLNMSQEAAKSLISVAFNGDSVAFPSKVALLLQVGCPVKGEDYDQLSEYLEKLPPGPASRYIHDVLYSPRSLADTCCFRIRRRVGRNLPQVVCQLQLPKKMVDFLSLTHVNPDEKWLVSEIDSCKVKVV